MDKEIQFKYAGKSSNVFNGKSFKESMETDTETETCFDGVVTSGSEVSPYTIEVERIRFETKEDYIQLRDIVETAKNQGIQVTTKETVRPINAPAFDIIVNYFGCIIDTKELEMNPTERTTENWKFVCQSKKEEVR